MGYIPMDTWYTKSGVVPNTIPVLSVPASVEKRINLKPGNDTFSISGTVLDADNDTLTVYATIGSVTKQIVVNETTTPRAWSLVWRTSEFNSSGTYSTVRVYVEDGRGGNVRALYSPALTVDLTPLYYWDKYSTKDYVSGYKESRGTTYKTNPDNIHGYRNYTFDTTTGRFSGVGQYETAPTYPTWAGTRLYNVGSFGMTENVVTNLDGVQSTSYTAVPNGTVKVKDTLQQSNILDVAKTYPDDGLHSDGFWYIKKVTSNMFSVLSVENSDISVSKVNSTLKLIGSIYDADGDAITIKATIGGIEKQIVKTNTSVAKPWELTWANLPEGIYRDIKITASDGEGGVDSVTFSGTIMVDKTGPGKAAVSVTPNKEWANETITVSITPGINSGVGTEKTQYKLNSESWIDYIDPFELTDAGVYELIVVSTYKFGNVGTELKQTIKIDMTAPELPDVSLSNWEWTN